VGTVLVKVARLVLALAVFASTATCLCAPAAAAAQNRSTTAAKPSSGHHCHGQKRSDTSRSPAGEHDEEHDCQHCQGSLALTAGTVKTTADSHGFAANAIAPVALVAHETVASLTDESRLVYAERPPSVDSPTLLRLHCALIS
jgi:hypothetical protein